MPTSTGRPIRLLADKATALGLPGVASYAEEKRVYPMNTVAAQVVGFAGTDGHGLAGIEYLYDKQLAGTPGRQVVVQDPAGQALRVMQSVSPTPGQDVHLTIDNGIQLMADHVLAETVRKFHAKGGTAIVENPKTGEIYAMSNVPLVNANRFGSGAGPTGQQGGHLQLRARLDLQDGHHRRRAVGRSRRRPRPRSCCRPRCASAIAPSTTPRSAARSA